MLPSTPLGPREETYHSGQALLAIPAPLLIPSYAFMGKEIFHSGWESQTISCIMWSWIRYSKNWLDPSSTTLSSVGLLEESLSIVCSSHPPLPTDNDEYPLFRDSNETTYPAYCLIEEETSSPLDPSIRNWIFIFQRSPGFLSFLVDRVGRALSISPIPPPMNELWAGRAFTFRVWEKRTSERDTYL